MFPTTVRKIRRQRTESETQVWNHSIQILMHTIKSKQDCEITSGGSTVWPVSCE